jgi:hypothetical protein
VRDTLLITGWCCFVIGCFALGGALLNAVSNNRFDDPSPPAGVAIFLFFAAALCLSAVKAMGGNLNPEHNLATGKSWRDSSLAEKKERMRFGFYFARGMWLAFAYLALCLWLFSDWSRDDSFSAMLSGTSLAMFSGMLLAESAIWALFIERPIFFKSGLYLLLLVYVAVSCGVLRVMMAFDSIFDAGLALALILAVLAVVIRLVPRRRRANSVETQLDGGKLANGKLSQAQSPAVNTGE